MWNFLAPMVGPIVDKLVDLIPNPKARATAKAKFEKDLRQAVTRPNQAPAEIKKIETGHSSIFVAGWRPFIGWVCGIGILWAFIIQPIAIWAIANFQIGVNNLPQIPTVGHFELVLAMLGMGGLRTCEKIKHVSRETNPGKGK